MYVYDDDNERVLVWRYWRRKVAYPANVMLYGKELVYWGLIQWYLVEIRKYVPLLVNFDVSITTSGSIGTYLEEQ